MVYQEDTKLLLQGIIMQIHESIQENGAFYLSIEMNLNDIERLIGALKYLKDNNNWHFHIANNFNENKNRLCDIEISYHSAAKDEFETLASPQIHYSGEDSKKF